MDDLISRQAAIDALRRLYIETPQIDNDFVYDMALDQADDAIKQLPPAQLGTDCISRQQAIKTVGWYSCHSGDELLFADNALRQLQPIQPDIVRCEECKYHYQRNCPIEKYFSLDGFCSRGKRREVTE